MLANEAGWAAIVGWRPRTSEYSGNARLHWAARARSIKLARELTQEAIDKAGWPLGWALGSGKPLIRLSMGCKTGRLPDGDNLQAALKAVRDQVCAHLGIDDNDESAEFVYNAWHHKDDAVDIMVLVGRESEARTAELWFTPIRERAG